MDNFSRYCILWNKILLIFVGTDLSCSAHCGTETLPACAREKCLTCVGKQTGSNKPYYSLPRGGGSFGGGVTLDSHGKN